MQDLLTDEQEALLSGERYWLDHLQLELARFNASNDDRVALSQAIRRVDELFLLLLLGDTISSQRVFLDRLLDMSLEEVILSDITRPMYLFKYGEHLERVVVEPSLATIAAPAAVLRGANLICAPGNQTSLAMQIEMLQQFASQTDIILFAIDPTVPFSPDAQTLLATLCEWEGDVIIVTLSTTNPGEAMCATITKCLGREPTWFSLAETTSTTALHAAIVAILREPQRLSRKLQYPLDVSFQIVAKYRTIIAARLDLLNGDFKTIEKFKEQIADHQQTLIEQSLRPFESIRMTLQTLEQRGLEYFSKALSPSKILLALNKAQSRAAFETAVLSNIPETIDSQTLQLLTWLAEENQRPWDMALQRLPARLQLETDPALDRIGSSFNYNRHHLLRATIAGLEKGRDAYDNARETQYLLASLQTALATMMPSAIETAGVGAVTRHMAITIMQEVLHLPTLLKLYVFPFSRTRLRQREQWKFAAMTRQLTGILEDQFYYALQTREQEVKSAAMPYTRFVYEERGYLSRVADALTSIARWLTAIEKEIKCL